MNGDTLVDVKMEVGDGMLVDVVGGCSVVGSSPRQP